MKKKTVQTGLCFLRLGLCVMLLASACSDRSHTNPLDPDFDGESAQGAQDLIAMGWNYFEQQHYDQASLTFARAMELDPQSQALLGWGWCEIHQQKFSDALLSLRSVLTRSDIQSFSSQLDAHAGLALVYKIQKEYPKAIEHALTILDHGSEYRFSHDHSINTRTLRLLLARCYVRMGADYLSLAQEQIDILWSANRLDARDHDSWQLNGTQFPTYIEALIATLEWLQDR